LPLDGQHGLASIIVQDSMTGLYALMVVHVRLTGDYLAHGEALHMIKGILQHATITLKISKPSSPKAVLLQQ
jgi:hypothetical protein